jgi:hypothetical protein
VLAQRFGPGTAATHVKALIRQSHASTIPRDGELPGGVRYLIHGIGCHFSWPDGRAVDVDVDPKTAQLIWDRWRVGRAFESDDSETPPDQIEAALRAATRDGMLRKIRRGWYAVPEA